MPKTHKLRFEGKADAYLEWAAATDFRYLGGWHLSNSSHGDNSDRRVGLLLQATDDTISTMAAPISDLLNGFAAIKDATRVALAAPIGASRVKAPKISPTEQAKGDFTMLGVVDDGCPFAQPGLCHRGRPRVLALWDQDGPLSPDGTYGRLMDRPVLAKALREHGDDDVAAYRSLQLHTLRRRATHGSHVLDLLAGYRPPRSRMSPSRETLERGDGSSMLPADWTTAPDLASDAPIVFVQLPQAALDDPTGRWLGYFVVDAIDFMIETARTYVREATMETKSKPPRRRLIINVSWGPQTGPHDGTSLAERALAQRFESARKAGIECTIALPAGNTYEARTHAQLESRAAKNEVRWSVPPGQRAPAFLEVWWPPGTRLCDVDLRITPPNGGEELIVKKPTEGICVHDDELNAALTVVQDGGRVMALLALAPTDAQIGQPGGAHGVWRLKIGAIGSNEKVGDAAQTHVYVARLVNNMGARRRSGPDGYLVDEGYEKWRQWRRPDAEDPPATTVTGEGTLNGLATQPDILMVSGYVVTRGAMEGSLPAAPYSSSGPGAAGERDPDACLPADESPVLRGILGSGVRAGTSLRLIGTSTAAPQAARKLANETGQSTSPRPKPGTPGGQGGQHQTQEPALRRRRRVGPGGPLSPMSRPPENA